MKPITQFSVSLAVGLSCMLLGCSGNAPSAGPSNVSQSASPHDHDQGPGDHSHEGHHHTAPHGGGLTELGEHAAHVEVVLDKASGRVEVYLLNGEANLAQKTEKSQSLVLTLSAPIQLDVALEPVADALTGETAESTSRFNATVEALKGKDMLRGTIALVELRGQTYRDIPVDFPKGISN